MPKGVIFYFHLLYVFYWWLILKSNAVMTAFGSWLADFLIRKLDRVEVELGANKTDDFPACFC